ncbi:hypothetical protein BO70DRAFT_348521 [Aspergillus heteromorphus CBS 117.55]|uniref:Uncharacterized protein n=1 Tax=Aspergillus heteromorphus CBS 117.55 TaxID=1448321 RepID=A0A317X0B5_9EURO|nr:uncharacterized protein BO70DRAFT_348521 [Aspergillus heteromorphus CBS 117.55]PWY92086.1 hypothetical protein BO70DRAFT_348521 [Aspergillus heteromorphus CBS 117.55]
MRTRSQQASPGGLVSLDDDRVPRRTRSTRSNTQQDATISATSSQYATRAKSQRATKKGDSTAKKSTTKAQSRKATSTKRTTRRSTRNADKAASDEDVQTHHEEEATVPSTLEADNNDSEKNIEPPRTEPKESDPESSSPMDPSPKDADEDDTPDSRGAWAVSCLQPLLDDLSSVGSPLSERSKTPSLASEDQTEAVLAPRTAQESGAIDIEFPEGNDKRSTSTPVAGDRTLEPPAGQTVTGPMEWRRTEVITSISSEQSASVADSGEEAVVEDEQVEALISAFAGLSLDSVTPRSSNEAAVPLMESTPTPTGELAGPLNWAQQVPSTSYVHRITGQLVEGPSASVELARVAKAPSTPQDGVRDYFLRKRRREVQVLSPLREESPDPGSGAPNVVSSLGSPGKQTMKAKRKKLTRRVANKKRAISEISDEAEPETPVANKRRNLGPPGSTPYRPATRPRALTANIAPHSERRRRRAVEREGRIHSTVFRVSQLLDQQAADRQRQASELSASPSPFPQPPQSKFDFSIDGDHSSNRGVEQNQTSAASSSEQLSTVQQPSTPERTHRGWNIRGLLNSVPRRFSRILHPFGGSPERAEVSEPVPPQPSSERITRTLRTQSSQPQPTVSENQVQTSRSPSEEPPKKRPRRSWSLFPTPIDRSLYLGDIYKKDTSNKNISKTEPATSSSAPSESRSTEELPMPLSVEEPKPQEPTVSDSQASVTRGREVTSQQASEAQETPKKRKRSPSPDVIPNPPGCSYGMDLDYFCYSSESEDEQETSSRIEPKKTGILAKTAVRSALRSERPSSKKVRFDASPENTPSKLRQRARATDPYRGRHFIGMGSDSNSLSTPETPTRAPDSAPAPALEVEDPRSRPGFVPNTQGTFQLDYDAFSDDSESSGSAGASPAANLSAPSPQTATPVAAQTPEPRPTPRPAPAFALPSTPAKIDDEALARARSQAEKYKPKTPSGLRTASRYSSPLTATPDMVPMSVAATPVPASAAVPAPQSEHRPIEDFGDDEFAREAQWLYENCPSGDLRDLEWPQPVTYEEQGFSREAIEFVNEVWDPSVVDYAYDNIWTPGLEAFKRELEMGMSEATLA